jgi:hypothetical protein
MASDHRGLSIRQRRRGTQVSAVPQIPLFEYDDAGAPHRPGAALFSYRSSRAEGRRGKRQGARAFRAAQTTMTKATE